MNRGSSIRLPLGPEAFERLLSEDEAIEALGLNARPKPRSSLRWLMRSGRLAYVRLGKGIYGFRKADILAFIEKARVPTLGEGRKFSGRI